MIVFILKALNSPDCKSYFFILYDDVQNEIRWLIIYLMKYTFRSETETVYLNADYKLVVLSSAGLALDNGSTTLTAVVRRISTGEDVAFPDECFLWKRHELSEEFVPVTGSELIVASPMLVNGSATFICYFSKEGLYWKDTATITIEETVKGATGESGWSTASIALYKRSATKPYEYDGETLTYVFSAASLSGNTGTWSLTIPDGNEPLYVIYASAVSKDSTDNIEPNEWTTPALFSKNGTDGEKGSSVLTLIIYRRSEDKPDVPSSTVTYSFKTGVFTGLTNWSPSIPDGDSPCWATTATAVSDTETDTIEPSEWADPKKVFTDGVDGTDGSDGAPGINAPYQRTVYKVSKDKPSKPIGDASALPSGWSLQPPPRTNNWKVWASVSYVSFGADNTPVYSEWSDPVEWSGETSVPIVQFQWCESDIYPPDETKRIMLVDGAVVVFEETAFVDDEGEWSDTVPDRDPLKPYLWKREYNYQHTSTEDEWFYYPINIKGLPGEYQSLGYIIAGTNSVIFAGLDEDKNPTLPIIHVFIQDMSYFFDGIQVTLTEKSDVYYLVATLGDNGIGSLRVAYLMFQSTGTTATTMWKDHDTDEIIEDGFVLAEIRMNGASIKSVAIITPRRFDAYEKTSFMEILNSGNMDDINVAAKALGIERVFQRVAALEAFISRIFANEIEMTYSSGVIGSIHSSGYNRGDYEREDKIGFYLGADGYAEFQNMIAKGIRATGSFEAEAMKTVNSIPAITIDSIAEEYKEEWAGCSSDYTTDLTEARPDNYVYKREKGYAVPVIILQT